MAEARRQRPHLYLRPGLLIVVLACVVHLNAVTSELVSDDRDLIPNAPTFHDPWDLKGIFGGLFWGDRLVGQTLYRPFTVWTLALNYRVSDWFGLPGPHAVGYHLVNVGLHACVSWLVWVLLLRLQFPRRAALAAGLLFAAHPIHTEAIALLTNRGTLLAACLGLAFLVQHRRASPLALPCLVLGLFSKESGLAILAVCLWLDLWFGRAGHRRSWFPYAGYGAAALVWLGVRATVVGDRLHLAFAVDNPLAEAALWPRVYTALAVQFDYLRLQVWPVSLSSDYATNAYPTVSSIADPRIPALLLGALAVLYAGLRFRLRYRALLGLAVAYALTLLPTSNLFLVIGAILAERWVYLPSAFFIGLVAWGLHQLTSRHGGWFWVPVCVALLAFSGLSVARNLTWRSQSAYLRAQIASAPGSARANYRWGHHHHAAGNVDSAAVYYRRALKILPTYPRAWNDLGSAYLAWGQLDSAAACYRRALRFHPGLATAHYGLGQVLGRQGMSEHAMAAYRTALRYESDYPEAHNNLASLLAAEGETAAAEAHWLKALELRPDYDLARRNLEILRRLQAEGSAPGR